MAAEDGGEVEVPADVEGAARGPPRPARPGRAAGARARLGRGRGLPPRRRAGARPGGGSGHAAARGARAPPADPFRPRAVRRRRRLPLPPPADPRHRLRRAPEVRRAPTCTSASPTGSNSTAELVEQDEIVGYHLEQAARYKHELGQTDPALAERAAARLTAAGQLASWRGDELASLGFYERALELTRPLRLDVVLEFHYAVARWARDGPEAPIAIAEAAAARADALGDEAGRAARPCRRRLLPPVLRAPADRRAGGAGTQGGAAVRAVREPRCAWPSPGWLSSRSRASRAASRNRPGQPSRHSSTPGSPGGGARLSAAWRAHSSSGHGAADEALDTLDSRAPRASTSHHADAPRRAAHDARPR